MTVSLTIWKRDRGEIIDGLVSGTVHKIFNFTVDSAEFRLPHYQKVTATLTPKYLVHPT